MSEQLACQYLTNISGKVFEKSYKSIIKNIIRRRPGIYALYKDKRLYYVGQTKNLRNRIPGHLKDRHSNKWNIFSVYLTIGDELLKELEAFAIQIAHPKGNEQKGQFEKADDLNRSFKRMLIGHAKEEINSLFGHKSQRADENMNKLASNKSPILRIYSSGKTQLRLRINDETYRARLLKSGLIKFKKRTYRSPSAAASAITKRPMNGWDWWEYERAPGDWVKIDELRK